MELSLWFLYLSIPVVGVLAPLLYSMIPSVRRKLDLENAAARESTARIEAYYRALPERHEPWRERTDKHLYHGF